MTAVPLAPPADAYSGYSAYGANLEAGLEGDISAPAQPPDARGRSGDRYGSEEGEEPYDFKVAAWSDEDQSSDWAERAGRSHRRRRRGWRDDQPSATLYVRVRAAASPCLKATSTLAALAAWCVTGHVWDAGGARGGRGSRLLPASLW